MIGSVKVGEVPFVIILSSLRPVKVTLLVKEVDAEIVINPCTFAWTVLGCGKKILLLSGTVIEPFPIMLTGIVTGSAGETDNISRWTYKSNGPLNVK